MVPKKEDEPNIEKSSLFKAITTIIIADVTMSLDNVLAVAGAAKDHYFFTNIWFSFIYCFNGSSCKSNIKMDKKI